MKKEKKNEKVIKEKHQIAKLALRNTIIGTCAALILAISLPYILNYPENTINNDFQVQMVGIKYWHQYAIILVALALSFYVVFRIAYRKVSLEKLNLSNKKQVNEFRKKCYSYPFITLVIQILVPTVVVAILLLVFNTNFELLMRLTIVMFCFFAIFASGTYMINRRYFTNVLAATSEYTDKPFAEFGLKIKDKLLLLSFPLFLYSLVTIILVSNAVMTTEKGDLQYSLYRKELETEFTKPTYTLEEAKQLMQGIALNSEDDQVFIFSAKDGTMYYTNGDINDFLVQYTLKFYDNTNGQCYEYYGKNQQAAVYKIHTTKGDYYVGIRFFVFSGNIYIPLLIVAFFCLIFDMFLIYSIGRGITNDLLTVDNGLKKVANQKDIVKSTNLPVTSNDEIGKLTDEYNKIQSLMIENVTTIQNNQSMLMEQERLASLGQLIGGIAHNLKTPIMSVSGAAEGLTDLINEYDSSIGDPEVTEADHHEIASDMRTWVIKVKEYSEYMSDIITAVKGQAVALSENKSDSFTIDELLKRVNILMKHELKSALVEMKVKTDKEVKTTAIKGDVNAMVQVVNNFISNAIQAYSSIEVKEPTIDLNVTKNKNKINIVIEDHGCGLPQKVQDKLFKEMITTKGKNGTGLGMFMSYSTIKGNFGGDITFETEEGKGTKFTIIIPV